MTKYMSIVSLAASNEDASCTLSPTIDLLRYQRYRNRYYYVQWANSTEC